MNYNNQFRGSHVGTKLLPQGIRSDYKNDAWQKGNMDILEQIGIAQIEENTDRFESSFRILDGSYNYKDVMNSTAFLKDINFWKSQTEGGKRPEHYGFIEPILNSIINIFNKRPVPYLVDATDALSTNDYIREKTDRLWNSLTEDLEKRIEQKAIEKGLLPQPEFTSEEEQQAYQQEVAALRQKETPQEIEREMNTNYKATYIDWVEKTMEEDYKRFDMDELDRNCQYDYMTTGKCFKFYRTGYDFYRPERWVVIDGQGGGTFCDESVREVEDGEYGGRIMYMSISEVLANWGHKMTADEKQLMSSSKDFKKLKESKTYSSHGNLLDMAYRGGGTVRQTPTPSFDAWENIQFLEQATGMDLGYTGTFPFGAVHKNTELNNKLLVTEAYWQSLQYVGYLTLADPDTGEPVTEIVTDEILKEYLKEEEIKSLRDVTLEQHLADPKPNTIVWDYITQTWGGIKINKLYTDLPEDLYIAVEPLPYQLKGSSEYYQRKLPLTGLNERTSFVSRLQDFQVNYNICMNAAKDYVLKDWGMFFLFDSTYLPEHLQGDEDALIKMREMAKEAGFLEIDGSRKQSSFNQFTAINMDMSTAAMNKLALARDYKREALESVGLSDQIMGTPTAVETATGVNQQVSAAHSKIDIWFEKFTKFLKRSNEIHINVAQYAKKEGIDGTVKYTDSDKTIKFINLIDPYLSLRNFRLTMENSSKSRAELEQAKAAFMNDNTIMKDLEAVIEVSSADSISKIKSIARYSRRLAEIAQEKQNNARQQEIKLAQDGETERLLAKQEFEARENQLDREASIYKQQILALGFDKEKDFNNNGMSDVIETGKLALEQLKINTAISQKEQEYSDSRIQRMKEDAFKAQELDIKRQEVAAKKYESDAKKFVARENKTNAEVKAAKSNSK